MNITYKIIVIVLFSKNLKHYFNYLETIFFQLRILRPISKNMILFKVLVV